MSKLILRNCVSGLLTLGAVAFVGGCEPTTETKQVVDKLKLKGAHFEYRGSKVIGVKFWDVDNTFSDDDVKTLGRLEDIEWLHLRHTKVTDKGLCAVKALSKLRTLSVDNEIITKEGLRCLVDLPNLEVLLALESQIDRETETFLKKHLPGLQIVQLRIVNGRRVVSTNEESVPDNRFP